MWKIHGDYMFVIPATPTRRRRDAATAPSGILSKLFARLFNRRVLKSPDLRWPGITPLRPFIFQSHLLATSKLIHLFSGTKSKWTRCSRAKLFRLMPTKPDNTASGWRYICIGEMRFALFPFAVEEANACLNTQVCCNLISVYCTHIGSLTLQIYIRNWYLMTDT